MLEKGSTMPLKLKLKAGEQFYVNGSHLQVERDAIILIESKNARILRQKDFMTEVEGELSTPHAFAYTWFLHHSSKKVMTEDECIAFAEMCVECFPTLAPIAKKKAWFSFYIEMRKLL